MAFSSRCWILLALSPMLAGVAHALQQPVALRLRGGSSSLSGEILEIVGPALVGLTIEPVASLVDTAFVSRLCGDSALAGVGVASSVFNVLAKSCNFLQSATTSHVARASKERLGPGEFDQDMARVASAAVYVAGIAGAAITIGLRVSGQSVVRALGVADQPEVAKSALSYLDARAWAAPAALGLMALQGAFRGARDARSPVSALLAASVANVALDAWLVPSDGVRGAALATGISQAAAAFLLVSQLSQRTAHLAQKRNRNDLLLRPTLADCSLVARSGSVLALRTLSGVFAMQYTTVLAAKLGSAQGAAHVVAYQIWLAMSLLADAVAVAVQALLADSLAVEDRKRSRAIVSRSLVFTSLIAFFNAAILAGAGPAMRTFFSSDPETRAVASHVWPIVVRSQAYSCGAFVCDGMLFAACDFSYCAVAMIASSLLSVAAQIALSRTRGLKGVWLGLELMMFLRFATGAARVASGTGPWQGAFSPTRRPARRATAVDSTSADAADQQQQEDGEGEGVAREDREEATKEPESSSSGDTLPPSSSSDAPLAATAAAASAADSHSSS